MPVDINVIQKKYPLVGEAAEVIGVWEFFIDKCPVRLKIKVWKSTANSEFPYQGIANYEIKTPEQAGPYRSLSLAKTVEEALEQALKGFLAF